MIDKLKQSNPLDDSALIIGVKFSKSAVMHKGDTLWVEAKVRFEKGNGNMVMEYKSNLEKENQ